MAKKSASQKAPAKKPLPAKKPATKKPVFMKKAPPQEASASKKPMVAKTKPTAATPALKKTELAPVMKPVFEESVPKPAAPVVSAPSPKLVMKTGAGGATSLTISAQTSAGAAANGNTHPANILALVSSGGWPVTELTKDHFTLMEYFEVPGQQAPFRTTSPPSATSALGLTSFKSSRSMARHGARAIIWRKFSFHLRTTAKASARQS